MDRRIGIIGATCVLAILLGVRVADADPVTVSCGDTLGPGGPFEITADIGPCSATSGPALTVIGPVTVDLGGHALTCAAAKPLTSGIAVRGSAAVVSNGVVQGCDAAVELGGDGAHRVERMTINGYDDRGFGIAAQGNGNVLVRNRISTCLDHSFNEPDAIAIRIEGDGNILRRNVIRPNSCGSGVVLGGDGNTLTGNDVGIASENGYVVTGDDNTLRRNVLKYSHFFGFTVSGSDNELLRNVVQDSNNRPAFDVGGARALVRRNTAKNAGWAGFSVTGEQHVVEDNVALDGEFGFSVSGTGSRVEGNVAVRNSEGGFTIDGTGHTMASNTAIANSQSSSGAAMWVRGAAHVVSENQVLDNYGAGLVVVAGASDNRIEGNVAFGNDASDLADENPGCGTTDWIENDFETRNQPCVQ